MNTPTDQYHKYLIYLKLITLREISWEWFFFLKYIKMFSILWYVSMWKIQNKLWPSLHKCISERLIVFYKEIFHVGTLKSDYSQYVKKEIKAYPCPACIYMNIYFSVQFYIFQSILWLYVNRIVNKKLFALVGSVSAQ